MTARKHKLDTLKNRQALTEHPTRPQFLPAEPQMPKGARLGYRRTSDSWVGRVHHDGTYKSKVLGQAATMQYWDAVNELVRFSDEVRDGQHAKKVVRSTLQNAVDAYLKKRKGGGSDREVTGADEAEMRLDALLPDTLLRRRLDSLKYKHVHDLQLDYSARKNLQGNQVKASTVNKSMTFLIATLNHARKLGLVESDKAWRDYERLPDDSPRVEFAAIEDRLAVINAAPEDLRLILSALHYCAARPSEMRRLTVRDVQLDKDQVLLTTYKIKSRANRTTVFRLPPGAPVREIFETAVEGKAADDYVFTTPTGKPWTQANLAKAHKAAASGLGLSHDTYAYRHGRISDWARAGIPAPEVAARTRTSLEKLQQTYYHTDDSLADKMAMM